MRSYDLIQLERYRKVGNDGSQVWRIPFPHVNDVSDEIRILNKDQKLGYFPNGNGEWVIETFRDNRRPQMS